VYAGNSGWPSARDVRSDTGDTRSYRHVADRMLRSDAGLKRRRARPHTIALQRPTRTRKMIRGTTIFAGRPIPAAIRRRHGTPRIVAQASGDHVMTPCMTIPATRCLTRANPGRAAADHAAHRQGPISHGRSAGGGAWPMSSRGGAAGKGPTARGRGENRDGAVQPTPDSRRQRQAACATAVAWCRSAGPGSPALSSRRTRPQHGSPRQPPRMRAV